jgi:hypothetical protein
MPNAPTFRGAKFCRTGQKKRHFLTVVDKYRLEQYLPRASDAEYELNTATAGRRMNETWVGLSGRKSLEFAKSLGWMSFLCNLARAYPTAPFSAKFSQDGLRLLIIR